MKLSSVAQESLVALLCYDTDYSAQVAFLVPGNYYDAYYSEIVGGALNYIAAYKEIPGEHTIDIVENLCLRFPDHADIYRKVYKSLQKTKGSINAVFVINQAISFVRYQGLKKAIGGALRSLGREDEPGLIEAENTLRAALGAGYEAMDLGVDLRNLDESTHFLETIVEDSIPTGIKPLDDLGLGPTRKRLGCVIGLAGSGKSWMLNHLAKHAHIAGYRVLYVTLELSRDEVCQRAFQGLFSLSKQAGPIKISRIESDKEGKFISLNPGQVLERPSLDGEDARQILYAHAKALENKPPYRIIEFPTAELTVAGLEATLNALEATESFIPDLLIIDYADLMAVDSKNYRLDLGQLYKKLRGLAIKRNMAVFTASQANRASTKAKWLLGDSAAEDWSKIGTCDTVITFNQTPAEHELGLARLFVAKGRTARDKFAILLSQAYAAGQFALDAVEFNPSYWDDLDSQPVNAITTKISPD